MYRTIFLARGGPDHHLTFSYYSDSIPDVQSINTVQVCAIWDMDHKVRVEDNWDTVGLRHLSTFLGSKRVWTL